MPTAAARDYRCSWELPYDFHPRIHAYPGVTSVVRAYMDGQASTAKETSASEEQQVAQLTQQPHKPERSKTKRVPLRHYRLRPALTPAAATSTAPTITAEQSHQENGTGVQIKDQKVKTAKKVKKPLPQHTPAPPTTKQSAAPTRIINIEVPKRSVANTNASPINSAGTPQAATAQTTAPQRHAVPPPRRPPASASFVPLPSLPKSGDGHLSSDVVAVGHDPVTTSDATQPLPPRHRHFVRYGSRTNPRYSLPPSYSATAAAFAHQPVPTVTVKDGRHAAPPTMREFRLDSRTVRGRNRANFVAELQRCVSARDASSSFSGDSVPRAVVEAYTDTATASTFRPFEHNFNAVLANAFEDSVAERTARLRATEQRMWDGLIVRVVPLPEAHDGAVRMGGVSVLDSGHVSDPIRVSDTPYAYAEDGVDSAEEGVIDDNFDLEEEEKMAVVVYPFVDEVCSTVEMMRQAEAQRQWPKGREWDRQAAIRAAVGPTVQEAILDLGLDPRYRRPGEHLRQRR